MMFERVHLRHAPGISGSLDAFFLDAGLTFIIGPNASGKSTLARTMRLALWSQASPPSIDATVDCRCRDGSLETIELRSGTARRPATFTRGDASLAGLYRLSLATLLQPRDAADEQFSARLQADLHGGIPIGALRAHLHDRTRFSRKIRQGLTSARTKARESQRKNRELLQVESELQRLIACREEASIASDTGTAIQQLLDTLSLYDQLCEVESELSQIPAGVESVAESDLETKRNLENRLRMAQQTLTQKRAVLSELNDRLAVVDDAWRELDRASLDVGQHLWDQQREAVGDVQYNREELETAKRVQAAARAQLFAEPLNRPLSVESRERIIAALSDVRQTRAEVSALEQSVGYFTALEKQTPSNEGVQRRIQALRDWLRVSPEHETPGALTWLPSAVGTLSLLVLIDLVYVLSATEWDSLWLMLGVVVSLLALMFSIWMHRLIIGMHQDDSKPSERETRVAAERAGVTLDSWTEASALHELGKLEAERAANIESERAQQRVSELRHLCKARTEKLDASEARFEKEVSALGLLPDAFELEAAEVFYRTEHWINAETHRARANCSLETAEQQLNNLTHAWEEWLKRHAIERHAIRVGASVVIDYARRQVESTDELRREIREAEKMVNREVTLVSVAEDDVGRLRERLGSWGESEIQLSTAIAHHNQLNTLKTEQRSIHKQLDSALVELQGNRELLERLNVVSGAELSVESLENVDRSRSEALLSSARASATHLREYVEESARLEEQLRHARHGHQLEDAYASVHLAEAASAQQASQRGAAALEGLLLDWSVDSVQHEGGSKSLANADEWLRRFTHGRFGIRLSGDGVLVGFDEHAQRERAFEELSDATRVQARLAARLAAIHDAEAGGEQLPLVLDEVFSTTDPERFESIAVALSEMVRLGRQIIYLTADKGEWERWLELASAHSLVQPKLVALGRLKGAGSSGVSVPERKLVPKPGDVSAGEYAELLGVAKPSLHTTPAAWPVLWLMPDELDAVHSVHMRRLETSGQVLGSAHRLGNTVVWGFDNRRSDTLTARLERRLDALRRLQIRWLRGTGREFRWEDVEKSGAISSTFEDRAWSAFNESDGEPAQFVEAIANLDRFRSSNVDALREYLITHGVLPESSPATFDELWSAAALQTDAVMFDARDMDWLRTLTSLFVADENSD